MIVVIVLKNILKIVRKYQLTKMKNSFMKLRLTFENFTSLAALTIFAQKLVSMAFNHFDTTNQRNNTLI